MSHAPKVCSAIELGIEATSNADRLVQVELGPGAQIKAMTKRIDNAVWKAFKNVAS